MIVIRIYSHGVGTKVRLETHATCCHDGRCANPDEEACERAYSQKGEPLKDRVEQVWRAARKAWACHSNSSLWQAMATWIEDPLPGVGPQRYRSTPE